MAATEGNSAAILTRGLRKGGQWMARTTRGKTVTIGPSKPGQKPLRFKRGGLHRSLGVPQGQKIPASKVEAAAEGRYGKTAAKQARFYQNVLKKGQRTAARQRRKEIRAQRGFAGVVRKPTRFLVGERGPELVDVMPLPPRRFPPAPTPPRPITDSQRSFLLNASADALLGRVRRRREDIGRLRD